MPVNRRDLLKKSAGFLAATVLPPSASTFFPNASAAQVPAPAAPNFSTSSFLAKAEAAKPPLRKFTKSLVAEVLPVADSSAFLRWRMERKATPGAALPLTFFARRLSNHPSVHSL
ncbi:MAG TPA: hypothetical protein VN025_05235 [Candidatus Dormibacteraeota bacterium]|jgi:hypothetical protein|nr:hypothetical protein [Candidatus Dormibacteraeota bacterium]